MDICYKKEEGLDCLLSCILLCKRDGIKVLIFLYAESTPKEIVDILEEYIKPAVASDRGNIALIFKVESLAWAGLKGGINSDSASKIDPSTGLVVDIVTGANESTVAWANLSQTKRLSILQIYNNYIQNTAPCP